MSADGPERRALEHAESASATDRLVVLCLVAAPHVALDAHERHAALRRAQLLLAAGGDPRRALELHGRAVSALAADLDTPAHRDQLAAGLSSLHESASGLPLTTGALTALRQDRALAWQCFAMSLLADSLTDLE